MIRKTNQKKWIILAAAILLEAILITGTGRLFAGAGEAVESLSTEAYMEWAGDIPGSTGEIVDTNGEVLWSREFRGYEDTYSLVGELKDVPYAENTAALSMEGSLLHPEQYRAAEGADSLEGTGETVVLTIDRGLNEDIYQYMKDRQTRSGSALFMEAGTGKIRAAVSLPGAVPDGVEGLPEGVLLNKNFLSVTPGSTMKIVTTLLLNELDEDLAHEKVRCDGRYERPAGDITCITQRGVHDIESAMGVSCNIYYGEQILQVLDPQADKSWEMLENMGFSREPEAKDVDGLICQGSSTDFDGSGSFSSTWSLIGQGQTQVSPVDMCMIVSAVVHDGRAPEAHLLETDKTAYTQMVSQENAGEVCQIWQNAYRAYYPAEEYHRDITVAKTGSAEHQDGVHKLLAGYIESSDMVFFIEVADYETSMVDPAEVAGEACRYLEQK